MHRHLHTVIALGLIGWLAANTPSAQGISKTELQERVKAHINERMYDCCRSVMLTERPDGTYEGFALLLNGVQTGLEVRVSGQDIAYSFTRLKPPVEPAEQPHSYMPAPVEAPAGDAVSQDADTPQTPPAADPTFTSAMYTRIQKGMTYRQVADLLGDDGEQLSSSYFDGAANQVYVWANPDDSHICIVFRDGMVLVKAQSGLPGIAPLPALQDTGSERGKFGRFQNWQLARALDGQITLLGLSLSQWLDKVSEPNSGQPARVEIVEREDGLTITLTRKDPRNATHQTVFYFTCLSPEEEGIQGAAGAEIEALCIPSRMMNDGQESNDPALTWKTMSDAIAKN